jgi:hypothetical protein
VGEESKGWGMQKMDIFELPNGKVLWPGIP